jgi:hypothetical protein
MLPQIRRQAVIAFRTARAEAKDEMVSEVVANAYCAFARLVERGKRDLAHPSTLAGYAIRQVFWGRRTAGRLSATDVSSRYAQSLRGFQVKSVHRFDPQVGLWQEVLIEDRQAGPAETAAARIDIKQWLGSLPDQKRCIAEALARGEETSCVARLFRLSPARISQLRQELKQSWNSFQGIAQT